jgi:hypothetical protein
VRKIEKINIPYLKHYENVVAKNPIYADERVYPAYWQQEPQALTLAKKQYELMQQGMDEEGAYDEAMKYIETLESASYAELKSLLEKGGLKDARKPFTADATVADAIITLRAKLKETPYNQMELAEQGEIDYIVQSKVLKWNEVERERRMKDPLFVVQFEKLREVLFPEIAESTTSDRLKGREDFKDKLLGLFQVNKSRLCTAAPFYYEEYAAFFAKLKAEPMLGRWNEREREILSRWIIDTLALREIIEKSPTVKVQRYLDDLRAQFFPMVRYPDRASSFDVPSTEAFKAVLFANDVGYKREGNKGLYVRRYYRIPMLLFPKETFTTSLLMDKDRAKAVAEDEKSLLQEVMSAGLDEASVPELQQQLRDLLAGDTSAGYISSDYGVRGGESGGVDMSQLDALLREADDDDTDDFAEADGEEEEIEVEEEEEEEVNEVQMSAGEWDKVVKKYVREPSTDLERERDEFLGNMEHSSWKDATSEIELYAFHRDRTENQLIIRARLSVEYEKKEAARRFREWRRRGVWIEKLPPPALELIDNRNS